jgi:hypothetical protein
MKGWTEELLASRIDAETQSYFWSELKPRLPPGCTTRLRISGKSRRSLAGPIDKAAGDIYRHATCWEARVGGQERDIAHS